MNKVIIQVTVIFYLLIIGYVFFWDRLLSYYLLAINKYLFN